MRAYPMRIEAIRCLDCGKIGLAVDDTRVTKHKCSGRWKVEAEVEVGFRVQVDTKNIVDLTGVPHGVGGHE